MMKLKTTALLFLMFLRTSFCHADPELVSMAIDGNGNMWTAIEVAISNKPTVIKLAYQPFGFPLLTPFTISDPSFSSQDPLLLMNKAGDAAACWLSYDPINHVTAVFISTLQAGQNWTTPERLSHASHDVLSDYRCELLITDTGKAILFWLAYDNIAGVVRMYSSNIDIGHTGNTTTIHSDIDENVTKAYRIRTTCSGRIVVSWNSYIYSTNSYINSTQSGDTNGKWYSKARITLEN
jgi:hypothetical protein